MKRYRPDGTMYRRSVWRDVPLAAWLVIAYTGVLVVGLCLLNVYLVTR